MTGGCLPTSWDASRKLVFLERKQISKTSKGTFSSSVYLGDRICVPLTFVHNTELFSKFVLFTPLLKYLRVFSCFTSMFTVDIVVFILVALMGLYWCYNLALIFISLTAKGVMLFLCLLATWTNSWLSICSWILSFTKEIVFLLYISPLLVAYVAHFFPTLKHLMVNFGE